MFDAFGVSGAVNSEFRLRVPTLIFFSPLRTSCFLRQIFENSYLPHSHIPSRRIFPVFDCSSIFSTQILSSLLIRKILYILLNNFGRDSYCVIFNAGRNQVRRKKVEKILTAVFKIQPWKIWPIITHRNFHGVETKKI